MNQRQAVIKAMEQLGGYATFGQLYQTAPKIEGSKWGTKTPFASIRRIVQESSEFFRIRPGLWGLSADKEAILERLSLGRAPSKKVEEFSHSYYQGLLVEIGNLRNLETSVPSQDKNRRFLDRPLGTLITLKDFYTFSYASLVQRARTVDVTWFNARRMPHSFFEVEHSTDFYNSLLKFNELQDFSVEFRIVADESRLSEFQSKLAMVAFKEIAPRIRFLSYANLSEWHSKTFELYVVEQKLG